MKQLPRTDVTCIMTASMEAHTTFSSLLMCQCVVESTKGLRKRASLGARVEEQFARVPLCALAEGRQLARDSASFDSTPHPSLWN